MLHHPLEAPIYSLTQNSISSNYTSHVPLLACLFLPAFLLQVNQCTISSSSVYQKVHFGRIHSFIAGLNMNFSHTNLSKTAHSVSARCLEECESRWWQFGTFRCRMPLEKKKTKKKPVKPTADWAFVPPLSEERIKEIISIL